jgi:hypothetical protein
VARLVFDGYIAGVGTAGGTRVVLGHWPRSPFGAFSDLMVEDAKGHRTLLAPTREVADFVAGTYVFDEVRVAPVAVRRSGAAWRVDSPAVTLAFVTGRRDPLGWLLRAVPRPLARHPRWIDAIDLPARALLPGVRTRGGAGNGRREWYGALDLRPITAATVRLAGADAGPLADIEPPVRFGFGSTPRRPALVRVVTTVDAGSGRTGRVR